MDSARTQAQAKGVAPNASREEGHTDVDAARPPKATPSPTIDGVDKIYHQLAEIHTIATAQLAECARWRRSNMIPKAGHTNDGGQGPAEPSTTRMAPLQLTDFSPKPRCGSEAHASKPRLASGTTRWVCNLSNARGTRSTVSPAAGGDRVMTSRGQGLRHLEATHTTCRSYYLSRHRSILSGTPPRSYAMSPPKMPPTMR
jgi:hypothetical protein